MSKMQNCYCTMVQHTAPWFSCTCKLHVPKLFDNLLISFENFSPTMVNKAIDNKSGAPVFSRIDLDQLFVRIRWLAFRRQWHTVRVLVMVCLGEHTCSSIRYLLTEWCLLCLHGKMSIDILLHWCALCGAELRVSMCASASALCIHRETSRTTMS